VKQIKDLLGIKDKVVFLSVEQGNRGIETYMDDSIKKFPEAYKQQIKSFLEGAIESLK